MVSTIFFHQMCLVVPIYFSTLSLKSIVYCVITENTLGCCGATVNLRATQGQDRYIRMQLYTGCAILCVHSSE